MGSVAGVVSRGIVLGVIVAAVAFPATAVGAPGDLTYRGCITGELESGPAGSAACAAIPATSGSGVKSGLDKLESVAVSPDGRSVYVAAGLEDDAVAHFSRDPVTGAVTYATCFSGDTSLVSCAPIAGATASGEDSGLRAPESIAVSPDGRSVYATSRFDDAIAQFSRDPASGALTYIGCDSSEDASVPPCDPIATPTADGINSGFDDPKIKAVVFSPDGRFVYASGSNDDSVVVLARDTGSGALSFDSCITGESQSSPPCAKIPEAGAGGSGSGLDEPRWLATGPDEVSLYAVANSDDAIARFSRNPATGALAFADCITGDSTGAGSGPGGSGACAEIPSASPSGNTSGFSFPRAMAISAEGNSAYAVSGNDAAVLSFDRDPASGALTYLGCVTGALAVGPAPDGSGACSLLPGATTFGDGSGFDQMRSMAISADGVSLYTSAQADDAVATFDRDPTTGALTYDGCVTGDADVACAALPAANPGGEDSGFDDLETIALSRDDRSLYGASEFDDAVSHFDREPVPQATGSCQGATVPKTDGTAGDDALAGTASRDLMSGLAGDDRLDALGGKDCVFGDDGRDSAKGGAGGDSLEGGSGNDRLRGNGGGDGVRGQMGNDALTGGGGRDRVAGAGGKDRLVGGGGRDRIRGGPGRDTIAPGGGKDRINCGTGNDKVFATEADRVSRNCERVRIKS